MCRNIIARGGTCVNGAAVVIFLPAGRSGVRVGRTDSVPCSRLGVSLIGGFASLRWCSGQVDVRARLRGGYGGRGRSPFRTLVAWPGSMCSPAVFDDDPERNGAEVTERSVGKTKF